MALASHHSDCNQTCAFAQQTQLSLFRYETGWALVSSAIWSPKGPLDLMFWSRAFSRLFKQAVPWLQPLHVRLQPLCCRSIFVLHILGRCHSSSSAFIFQINVNTFSPSFIWICLTSVTTSGSCCLALWDWRVLLIPAITIWVTYHCLLLLNAVMVPKSHGPASYLFSLVCGSLLCPFGSGDTS